MELAASQTIIRTYRQPLARVARPVAILSIIQRLHRKEKDAVADCINAHGNKIWAFSKLHTRSNQEAEELAKEIFQDIWIYAERNEASSGTSEELIIQQISFRRLLKHKWRRFNRI